MNYLDYSPLIDTGLIVALAVVVWAAYRELRARKTRTIVSKEVYLD